MARHLPDQTSLSFFTAYIATPVLNHIATQRNTRLVFDLNFVSL
jgi:hypothetical protein